MGINQLSTSTSRKEKKKVQRHRRVLLCLLHQGLLLLFFVKRIRMLLFDNLLGRHVFTHFVCLVSSSTHSSLDFGGKEDKERERESLKSPSLTVFSKQLHLTLYFSCIRQKMVSGHLLLSSCLLRMKEGIQAIVISYLPICLGVTLFAG